MIQAMFEWSSEYEAKNRVPEVSLFIKKQVAVVPVFKSAAIECSKPKETRAPVQKPPEQEEGKETKKKEVIDFCPGVRDMFSSMFPGSVTENYEWVLSESLYEVCFCVFACSLCKQAAEKAFNLKQSFSLMQIQFSCSAMPLGMRVERFNVMLCTLWNILYVYIADKFACKQRPFLSSIKLTIDEAAAVDATIAVMKRDKSATPETLFTCNNTGTQRFRHLIRDPTSHGATRQQDDPSVMWADFFADGLTTVFLIRMCPDTKNIEFASLDTRHMTFSALSTDIRLQEAIVALCSRSRQHQR